MESKAGEPAVAIERYWGEEFWMDVVVAAAAALAEEFVEAKVPVLMQVAEALVLLMVQGRAFLDLGWRDAQHPQTDAYPREQLRKTRVQRVS